MFICHWYYLWFTGVWDCINKLNLTCLSLIPELLTYSPLFWPSLLDTCMWYPLQCGRKIKNVNLFLQSLEVFFQLTCWVWIFVKALVALPLQREGTVSGRRPALSEHHYPQTPLIDTTGLLHTISHVTRYRRKTSSNDSRITFFFSSVWQQSPPLSPKSISPGLI